MTVCTHFGNSYIRARTNDPYLCRRRNHRRLDDGSTPVVLLALFSPFSAFAPVLSLPLSLSLRTLSGGSVLLRSAYINGRPKGRSMERRCWQVGPRARWYGARDNARDIKTCVKLSHLRGTPRDPPPVLNGAQ